MSIPTQLCHLQLRVNQHMQIDPTIHRDTTPTKSCMHNGIDNRQGSCFLINASPSADASEQDWLGMSRSQCTQQLLKLGLRHINFAHWLSIPKLGLLLVFHHQHCITVEAL